MLKNNLFSILCLFSIFIGCDEPQKEVAEHSKGDERPNLFLS